MSPKFWVVVHNPYLKRQQQLTLDFSQVRNPALEEDFLIAIKLVSLLRAKCPVDLPLRDILLQVIIPGKKAEMIEQRW